MTHTFLFEEGLWDVKGRVVKEDGRAYDAAWDARIVHWPGVWLIETRPTDESDEPEGSEVTVEVTPTVDGTDHTTWTGFDSTLGKQHGHFVFVDDSILSAFECDEGSRHGTEVIRRIDDDRYESVGALFEGERKIASWERTSGVLPSDRTMTTR